MQFFSRREFLALGAAAVAQLATAVQPCAAAARWIDHQSYGPFRFHATFPLGQLHPLFQELSALELELQRTLAVPPASQPIDVFLLESKKAHEQYLTEMYPHVPYRRALFVQRGGQGRVFAYRHHDLIEDLRHECTHALLHANLPMVPLWLDEGLAKYFELPAEQRAFDHEYLRKLRLHLKFGMIQNIRALESLQELNEMGSSEYRFSWAWVHFMLHGPLPVHRELVHYLADIRRGNPPGKLSDRLYHAVPDLDKQLVLHFKNWKR